MATSGITLPVINHKTALRGGQNQPESGRLIHSRVVRSRRNHLINYNPAQVVNLNPAPTHQQLVALIDLELLRESVPEEFMDAIGVASRQHVPPASHDAIGRLGATLNALLDNTQTDPQALQHPQAVRSMEQDLLAAFRHSLALPTSAPRRVGRAIRQGGLHRAVEYLRSWDTGSVTVADLCAAARVTQRTLEYAFRENFGMSPVGFLQLLRYHAARRDMLAADAKAVTVTEIAQKNGFYLMGRFAVRYKALFGESPSQTLQRSPEKGDRYLLHPADLGLL